MAAGYIPPSSTQLPFVFTASGYVAPTGELLFEYTSEISSFNNLNAAVQVMQLYHDEAYTYVKSCPKYVVGYNSGAVQIMKGRCVFGGIRDLWSSITGIYSQTADLASVIKVMRFGTSDLYANISTHLPEDFRSSIRPVHKVVTDFQAAIATHLPEDFRSSIRPVHKVVLDLQSVIHGWQESNLYATILMHPPKDLEASVFVRRTDYGDLNTSIHAWHIKDLQARLDRVFPFDLSGTLHTIQPIDLPAYLKVRYAKDLNAYLKGWGEKNLSAAINIIFARDLNVLIYGRDDMFKNLYCRIKGIAVEVQSSLSATLRAFIGKDLSAILRATYLSDLSGYLVPVLPKDIKASIYAWHSLDLQVILIGQLGEWDLQASIFPNNNLSILGASICSRLGTKTPTNLTTSIHSWEVRSLTGSIDLIEAANLQATLTPRLYSGNLHASIYPKMIRLTSIIRVATMEHKNLSAMINSFCAHSDYKNLSASVYVTYKSDLPAYIKALKYVYKPISLGASIGYADTITEVDKYRISFNILEGSMRTFDRYTISLNIFGAVKYLSAYINGIMRSVSLSASITAVTMDPFSFGTIKDREPVVHLSYSGVHEGSEMVELSFKSMVKDYYYSSSGDSAWKTDRLDRWVLSLKSYLPKDEILKLRRRLHRGAELYDLKRFSSIDEAVRYAIAYVSEYPKSDLSAGIYCRGTYSTLSSAIHPIYTKSSMASLTGTLLPVRPTIIVSTDTGEIVKM